jgi:hypothetical protein
MPQNGENKTGYDHLLEISKKVKNFPDPMGGLFRFESTKYRRIKTKEPNQNFLCSIKMLPI